MIIERFEVEGLNGEVNTTLEFNEDLNIITGANGSGKTTLLQLIWYLFSGQIERALGIRFDFVSVATSQFKLSITNEADKFLIRWSFSGEHEPELATDYEYDQELITNYEDVDTKCADLKAGIMETMKSSLFFPSFRRIEGGFSRIPESSSPGRIRRETSSGHAPTRETKTLQDVIAQFADMRSVGNHKFVVSFSTNDIVELVPQEHIEISEKINAIYADLSGEFEEKIPANPISELQETNSILEQIRQKLAEAASEVEELRKPLTSLNDFVDRIFSSGIKVAEGFTLGKENGTRPSDQLSSGEKQMLSFLCYNAFSSDTAIFIDEPELSLHLDWQRSLLRVLLQQATGNQFFIATHSPFIYTQYPDKELPFDES